MRPKVIAFTLLAAVLFAAVIILPGSFSRRSAPKTDAGANAPAPAEPAVANVPSSGMPAVNSNTLAAAPSPADPERVRRIRQRALELNALAMNDDVASRDAILAEMQNPEKEIRKAALEAAIQTGDRSVVPRLQEVAATTEDPREKAEILAAIDYINLPSLTEYLAEQRSQNALGLTNRHATPTNRLARHPRLSRTNSPSAP